MISLLVVNYRSAGLAAAAVRSAREACSAPLEVVVVDNSCDPREAAALEGLADTLVISKTNRGYAGAINDGRRHCSGSTLVISNPDVVFGPSSIDRLTAALADGAAAAGPALHWDDALSWLLPPGDVHRGSEKIDEILAARSRDWFRARDRRRLARRIAFWSLRGTTTVETLSGAVLAVRGEAFDEAEGFDERFPLYFEETDFLRRLRSARQSIVYVPESKCRHLFNQSAGQDSDAAAARYAGSEMRYLEKWNGPFAARAIAWLARPARSFDAPPLAGPIALDREGLLIEASPLPGFATAAGCFPAERRVEVPAEVVASLRGAPLYLRLVDPATCEVLRTWALEGGPGQGAASASPGH